MLQFKSLQRQDMPLVLKWRNANLEAWRTPRALTLDEQYKWWDDVVSKADPPCYWGIWENAGIDCQLFLGQAEVSKISKENLSGEIGLLISPYYKGLGYGKQSALETYRRGFEELGLKTIYGEVYHCNAALNFWLNLMTELGGYTTILPNRKYWDNKFWDATYFSLDCEQWKRRI